MFKSDISNNQVVNALGHENDGLVQALQQFAQVIGAKQKSPNTWQLPQNDLGKTIGGFLSAFLGHSPSNPITSFDSTGVQTAFNCPSCTHNTCVGGQCHKCENGQCNATEIPYWSPAAPEQVNPIHPLSPLINPNTPMKEGEDTFLPGFNYATKDELIKAYGNDSSQWPEFVRNNLRND